jgi:hypothetical protein
MHAYEQQFLKFDQCKLNLPVPDMVSLLDVDAQFAHIMIAASLFPLELLLKLALHKFGCSTL